jgi:hypothetical protein
MAQAGGIGTKYVVLTTDSGPRIRGQDLSLAHTMLPRGEMAFMEVLDKLGVQYPLGLPYLEKDLIDMSERILARDGKSHEGHRVLYLCLH